MTRAGLSGSAIILALVALVALDDPPANADPDPSQKQCQRGVCYVEARRPPAEGNGKSVTRGAGNGSTGADEASLKNDKADWSDSPTAAVQNAVCAGAAAATGDAGACRDGTTGQLNGAAPARVPLITPGQAGAIAAARLKIPTVAPGIGPSPNLNRWKMAAVGYPLWLWADGPTQVGPVSDSVAGLSVSLSAEVTSLTFRMGDGTTVTCQGDGDKWTKAVEPGTKAPGCGHTYTKPSLPRGNYKVAALTEWAVTWTANGQSGVIDVPAVQTTELPVGELQVLVR